LKAKTCLYLFTKLTAGISSCTTSHERLAVAEVGLLVNCDETGNSHSRSLIQMPFRFRSKVSGFS